MERESRAEREAAMGAKCVESWVSVPEPRPEGRIARWADEKAKGSFDPEAAKRKEAWNRDPVDRLGRGFTYLFLLMAGVVMGAGAWIVAAIQGLAWLGGLILPVYVVLGVVAGRWWLASADRHAFEREVWRRRVEGGQGDGLYSGMHLAGKLRLIATEAPFDPQGYEGLRGDERAAILEAADRLEACEVAE